LNKLYNQVLLYDTVQGKLLWKTPASPYRYLWLAFSGDGNRLLSAGHFPNPKTPGRPIPFQSGFQVWDVRGQKLVVDSDKLDGFSNSWIINHDGTKVAGALRTRRESYLTMFEITTETKQLWRSTVNYKNLISLAFSPDGEALAGVNFEPERNFVALWSVASGEQRWRQFGNFEATQVAFTSDSKRVLTLGYASDIMMHDSLTGREVLGLTNRGKPRINDYSLSPRIVFNQDDTILATHSWDGTISFWHAFNKQAYDKNPQGFEKTKRIKAHTSDD
jgi:WD40 repeat protein